MPQVAQVRRQGFGFPAPEKVFLDPVVLFSWSLTVIAQHSKALCPKEKEKVMSPTPFSWPHRFSSDGGGSACGWIDHARSHLLDRW